MARQTLYEILGIPQDAPSEAILQAYEMKKSALEKACDGDALCIVLTILDHARDQLVDPVRRTLYDEMLKSAEMPE